MRTILFFVLSVTVVGNGWAQEKRPARVDISPARLEAEVGQSLRFTAQGFDEDGGRLDDKPSSWFATPFDLAAADENGAVTLYAPGEVRVGAMVGGKAGFALVIVKPMKVARIDIEPVGAPLVVGGEVKLSTTARTANGDPRADVELTWVSDNPSVADVDSAGLVTGIAAGKASIRATADSGTGAVAVEVVRNPVASLEIEPRTAKGRTGDVVRLKVNAKSATGSVVRTPAVRWAVSGEGATIEQDGAFVAEKAGTYAITAISGDRASTASILITPRQTDREIEVVGRTQQEEAQVAEQWIVGNHAYLTSILAGKLWVYDIASPGSPKKIETVSFDARVINDVSTTPDGKIGVLTREGASNRKNGIVFLDLADPSHPKVISEYTETVTGGVHSAFIDSHYVYLTDDATGSVRVIDFKDAKNPKEVARWQVENPLAKTIHKDGIGSSAGRYLHDIYVKDGLMYMGYWRDGLIVLDVGNGIKGGRPESPRFVSQLRFNYHELYGPGWVAGAHSVFRYKNYVFVGDEVFPGQFNLESKDRIPTRGIVHVVDVSDILSPRKVAYYDVPEAGAHNMWVENDVMYMGYYGGGARVVDVSGELRGDLYRQGREMARLWTGDAKGFRPNLPFAWGAQPHNGLIYFNDIHTGIWVTKLVDPKDRGK